MTKSRDDVLQDVHQILSEIRSLFILANKGSLDTRKAELLPKGSVKEKIYELCDGSRTASEIGEAIGKDNPYVNSYLSILRSDGLIRSVNREGKHVHEKIY